MDKRQWARGLFPFLTSLVLMTSASGLSSDHTNSKSTGVLDAAANSNVASQNTAAVPSSSSLSMSSSKDFHSSTLAISSSPFAVLSAGMANKQTITPLTLVSSVLVTSSVLVSTSVVPSSALSRSDSSSVATMSSNLITEQGTSAVTSVSSLLLSSSTISVSSLQQSHLTAVVVGTTLAIDKSTPETPSPSSMLLVSSTVVSHQSVCTNMTTLNEISGVITRPFYPRYYPYQNQSCSWEIRARKGKRIVFTIEDMGFHWWCIGRWYCLCYNFEIQGGSISGYDGPKWRVCAAFVTANVTYDWFKERIKVLFFFDGRAQGDLRFRISYTQVNFSVSGCSSYTTLKESNRAMTYNRSISYLCDSNLNGWYRFTGEAGTQMADSCVNMYHCGTESPGWLNGTHPDLNDGAVKRQVCFSSFENCCHHSSEITVQHCGGFYVYKLERQSQCNLRYCGNGLRYAQECYIYKVLNETSRSKTYNESYYQCDDVLSTDWYRFSGAAGNQMAESCVDNFHCGTYLPGWLNGSHPTVNEGAVQRRVCFRYRGDCCFFSIYIRVRNCGGFYVYQLKPLTLCDFRYCGNGYVTSTPLTQELPQTTTTKVTPATGTLSTTDPEITPTQLPQATTTKVTPATGTLSTTDPEITPTGAMYIELENRSIVFVDIDKEIIGRRGSIRQKKLFKIRIQNSLLIHILSRIVRSSFEAQEKR